MNAENLLEGTASLFLALGDKTRLRLLNLMRDREICVSSFTGTLGHSQPLISRHLAYLRNSGLVEARREGKWMHYRVAHSLDDNTTRLLLELFKWMENQEGLRLDRQNYQEAYPAAVSVAAANPQPQKERTARDRQRVPKVEPVYEGSYEPAPHHNELEDFLL
ncbi:MAG: metalloregulator ArsR/SmtB family transcription factor [Acidobacteriota bacterium]